MPTNSASIKPVSRVRAGLAPSAHVSSEKRAPMLGPLSVSKALIIERIASICSRFGPIALFSVGSRIES